MTRRSNRRRRFAVGPLTADKAIVTEFNVGDLNPPVGPHVAVTGSAGAVTPWANYDFNGNAHTSGAIITVSGTISADPWATFSF